MSNLKIGDYAVYLGDKKHSFYGQLLVVTQMFGNSVTVRVVGTDKLLTFNKMELADKRDLTPRIVSTRRGSCSTRLRSRRR